MFAFIFWALVDYEVLPGLTIYSGLGIKLEKNKSFLVFRFNTEYSSELKKDWGYFLFLAMIKRNTAPISSDMGLKKRF